MSISEDTKRKYEKLAEDAIEFGKKMQGARYGAGWREGTWPDLSPLYARITRSDPPRWYRERECICSGLINVLRYEIAGLPAVGRAQGDLWPGGMGAIGRVLAYREGTRRYDHVKPTPRGWLCVAEYTGSDLAKQGHVGIALEKGSHLLEARVPKLTDNRIEEDVSDVMVAFGGRPFTRIVPPWIWLRV